MWPTARVMSPLCACLPYISGTNLQEWVLATAGLKDDDSSLVITQQVGEVVCELGNPQLDGQSSGESLEVINERVPQSTLGPRREGSMVRSSSREGFAARHVGIDVELYRVPVILMNDESAICGGEKLIKPG